jgi:hypothetical protein
MTPHMIYNTKNALIIVVIIASCIGVGILAALWATNFEPNFPVLEPRPFPPNTTSFVGDFEFYYTAKTVISSVNITLVSILLATYLVLYKKTRSEFVLGLILFALVFLLYTLVSNPITQFLFGFRAFGLGPFAMLPDLFAFVALIVLLYLTLKY